MIDPAKVTISALENAVSVGTLLLTTDAMVAEIKKDEDDEGAGMEGMEDY